MLVLELLGTLSLRNESRPVPVVAQQKRSLGLLAILALAGKQGLPRDRIESYLWPESSAQLARHSLDQTVYAVRHALGSDFILSTAREIRLNPELVQVDLWGFGEAIRAQDWAAAADRYKGALLDGFHLTDSRELESWIDGERARLRSEYQTAVDFLATAAAEAGDHSRSVTWWRRLANSEPLSASATKKLMRALAAAGDRTGAVKHARLYQELVRHELEIEPDAEVEALAVAFSHPAVSETRALGKETGHFPRTAEEPNASPPALTSAPSKKENRRERTALYAMVPIAIVMTGAAIWGWMRPEASKAVVRYPLVVDSTEAMAKRGSWTGRLALSPDGSRLAYIGGPRSQLLIRPRNELRATAVPGTEGASTPFFSPDGSQVGFLFEKRVQIAPVDLRTPPITVTDTLTGVTGASWGPDGFIDAETGRVRGSLARVEAKPNAMPSWVTVLDTASGEFDHTWPDVLPSGKGVLFTVAFRGKSGGKDTTSYAIAVADLPSGKHRVIVNDATYARYATSGYLLYVMANKTLMVAPFDQNSLRITGEPTALTADMRVGVFGSADLSVSATGTLVYATGEGDGKWEVVWVTRDGKAVSVDSDWLSGAVGGPELSPDGKWLAVARSASNELINIWIKRLDRGPSIKLTLNEKYNFNAAWTPDGRSVTFSSGAPATGYHLSTKRADGSAQEVLQFRDKRNLYNPQWSPDGKWLMFQTDPGQDGAGDILGVRPGIDSTAIPVVATRFSELAPTFSPDGHWLAYASNESGRYEIYVVPFPNTRAGTWAVSTRGGTEPQWSHRGNELFYRDASRNLVAVDITTRPTLSVGRSTVLFSAAGYLSNNYGPQYAVAPDDQRFLMIRPLEIATADRLIVVDNWSEELRSKSRQ